MKDQSPTQEITMYFTKTMKGLIAIPVGETIYTSLAYREDKRRRGLQILCKLGFFKQDSRYSFTRIKNNGKDKV